MFCTVRSQSPQPGVDLIPVAAVASSRLSVRINDEATTLLAEMRERIADRDLRCAVLAQALYLEGEATW